MPSTLLDDANVRTGFPDREVHSVCPYCGVGCQLTYHIKDDKLLYVSGRNGPANENRLCVKGRFGFDYVNHPHRLMQPLIRRDGIRKHAHDEVDPANPWTHFRAAAWDEALERAAPRPWPASARPRVPTRRPISSRSSSAPASAPTTSITARGCVMPPRLPLCSRPSARRR
jgi:anaerobic selenocysteine-containing dehydrogenase